MISEPENFQLNLSASCTREQAVLRLLGWGTKTIYPTYLELPVTEDGLALQDTKQIYGPEIGLEKFLDGVYRDARAAYAERVSEHSTDEQIKDALRTKWYLIEEAELLIERARGYLIDIVDELAKGDASALRVDHDTTQKTGIQHLTIKSLDEWSLSQYPKPGTDDSTAAIALSDAVEDSPSKKYRSLYITMHFLVQEYARRAGTACWSDTEGVNVKAVSKKLEAVADAQCKPDSGYPGQKQKSIEKRIADAEREWRVNQEELKNQGRIS